MIFFNPQKTIVIAMPVFLLNHGAVFRCKTAVVFCGVVVLGPISGPDPVFSSDI